MSKKKKQKETKVAEKKEAIQEEEKIERTIE